MISWRLYRFLCIAAASILATYFIVFSLGIFLYVGTADHKRIVQFINENTSVEIYLEDFERSLVGANVDFNAGNINIRIEDDQGRLTTALMLEDVRITTDLWRSLVDFSPRFYLTSIDSADIYLVEGEHRTNFQSISSLLEEEIDSTFHLIEKLLGISALVDIQNFRISLFDARGGEERAITRDNSFLQAAGSLEADIVNSGYVQLSLSAFRQGQLNVQAHVEKQFFYGASLQELYLEFEQHVESQTSDGIQSAICDAPCQLWIDRDGGYLEIVVTEGASLALYGFSDLENNLARFDFDLVSSENFKVAVDGYKEGDDWLIESKHISLSELTRELLEYLPKGRLKEIISTLDMNGEADLIALGNFGLEKAPFMLVSVQNSNNDAWRGIPSFKNLSMIVLSSDFVRGDVLVDSEKLFAHFAQIYQSGFEFDDLAGVLSWDVSRNRLQLKGRSIVASQANHSSALRGVFSLDGRLKKDQRSSLLNLSLFGTNLQQREFLDYFPDRGAKRIKDWFSDKQYVFDVPEGQFIFSGGLAPTDRGARQIISYAESKTSRLSFDNKWPAVTEFEGKVYTNNNNLKIIGDYEIAGLEIYDSNLNLDLKKGGALLIEGHSHTSLEQIGLFVKQLPVAGELKRILNTYSINGYADDTHFKLIAGLDGRDIFVEGLDIKSSIRAASVEIPDLDIQIDGINGNLSFDESRGFQSNSMLARVFGREVQVQFGVSQLEFPSFEKVKLDVELTGNFSHNDIERVTAVQLNGVVEGDADIRFLLSSNEDFSSHTFAASSELNGIAVNLPDPFTKIKSENKYSTVRYSFDNPYSWELVYDDLLKAAFKEKMIELVASPAEAVKRKFGKDAVFVPKGDCSTVAISGAVESFDFPSWQSTFTQLSTVIEDRNSSCYQFIAEELKIGNIIGLDDGISYLLDDMVLSMRYNDDQLEAKFITAKTAGAFFSPQLSSLIGNNEQDYAQDGISGSVVDSIIGLKRGLPLNKVELEYLVLDKLDAALNIEASEKQSESVKINADERVQTEFSRVPLRFDVSVDRLSLEDQNLGRWSFDYIQRGGVRLIDDIQITLDGLSINSETGEGVFTATNSDGERYTDISLHASAGELPSIHVGIFDLEKLPYTAEKSNYEVTGGWKGSLRDFSFAESDLTVDFTAKEGRFLNLQYGSTDLLKVSGIFNVDKIFRRLQLDFKDVIGQGFHFDELTGSLNLSRGDIYFREKPIIVDAPSSKLQVTGVYIGDTQFVDSEVVVTLPTSNNLPWIAALMGNLPVAAGAYIAGKVFDDELANVSSAVYKVKGPVDDLDVQLDRVFDGRVDKQ